MDNLQDLPGGAGARDPLGLKIPWKFLSVKSFPRNVSGRLCVCLCCVLVLGEAGLHPGGGEEGQGVSLCVCGGSQGWDPEALVVYLASRCIVYRDTIKSPGCFSPINL